MHLTLLYITALTLILRGSATILSGGGAGTNDATSGENRTFFACTPLLTFWRGTTENNLGLSLVKHFFIASNKLHYSISRKRYMNWKSPFKCLR